MIENYFHDIENSLQYFKRIIKAYSIDKKIYNQKQGFIKGEIVFVDDSKLHFIEVKNTELKEKIKYRYHYMLKGDRFVFRYDNAPHHRKLKTFPHHKHTGDRIVENIEPELYDILVEIQESLNLTLKK